MTKQLFTNGYALIIGVGHCAYQRWSLPVTAEDAKAIEGVLTHPRLCAYDPDHIQLIHDKKASRSGILDALNHLGNQIANDANATAVIYYSGHGMKDENGAYYLIPHDTDPLDIKGTALAAAEFADAIRDINARRLLAVLDCCHAEGMASSKEAQPPSAPPGFKGAPPAEPFINRLKQGEGRAVFTSSRGNQLSWVLPDQSLSIYTHFLIRGLQGAHSRPGDTTVSIATLMDYLNKQVPAEAEKHYGQNQTPFFDMTAENFPIALIKGGKGLPAGGWKQMKNEIESGTVYNARVNGGGSIAQGNGAVSAGQGGIAIGGDVRGGFRIGRD